MDNGSINELAFSPCGLNLAIASQDGFLRVFRYESMELLGIARSYFGGFLCVCWSPDGKYIVVGGEDDLVTIWSMQERRVVARGQGHRSWVSVVAFDPYTTSYGVAGGDGEGSYEDPYVSDDDGVSALYRNAAGPRSNDQINNNKSGSGCASGPVISNRGGEEICSNSNKMSNGGGIPSNSRSSGRRKSLSVRPRSVSVSGSSTSYRLGSVSQDTQLCLWDITEDVLRQPVKMLRHSVNSPTPAPEKSLSGGSLRIEVKPSQGGAAAAAVAGTSSSNNNYSSSSTSNNNHNSNTGQTPVSSLSSISSSDKVDGTVLARDKDVVAVAVQLPPGKNGVEQEKLGGTTATTATAAVTTTTTQVVGGSSNNNNNSNTSSSSNKQKSSTGGISLIGNCVGNNLNKMTMSSSISSTSSTASGGGDGEDMGGGAGGGVAATAGPSSTKAIGNGAKSSLDSTSSSSGMMTLNAFTQRLSHFSFGNDKKNGDGSAGGHQQQQHQGKKGFTLSKPFGGGSNSISSE